MNGPTLAGLAVFLRPSSSSSGSSKCCAGATDGCRSCGAGFAPTSPTGCSRPMSTRTITTISVVPPPFRSRFSSTARSISSGWNTASGRCRSCRTGYRRLEILVIGDFIGYWMHRAFHGRRAVALPCRAPFLRRSRLAVVRARAPGERRIDAHCRHLAGAGARLRAGSGRRRRAGADADGDPGARQCRLGLGAAARRDRLAALPSLASHGRIARRDKNFAGLLPLWDLLFGTYYMPRELRPSSFGTETPVPKGLIGQLVFPFRRERAR